MSELPPVTLEILVTPRDLRHAQHVLPHQLRVWGDQVQEIVCTVDTLDVFGRPADEGSPDVQAILQMLDECLAQYPHGRRVIVDISEPTFSAVCSTFFENAWMPPKDYRGTGGFYGPFFGLYESSHEHVLHVDCDMVFGGASKTWVREALTLLRERPDVLAVQPLMAPPTVDGYLRYKHVTREPCTSVAYRLAHNFSWRCFLLDKRVLRERVGPLELLPGPASRERVPLVTWLRALPNWSLADVRHPRTLNLNPWKFAEDDVAHGMMRAGLYRVSILGEAPGVWMIHPGIRTKRAYELFPTLVERVERGEIPEVQRGRWNLEDATLDWLEEQQAIPRETPR